MEFYSLNGFPACTDDFYCRELSDLSDKAIVIHNPQGIYYGGTIAAPVVKTIFENILPYLGIEKTGE